MNNENNIKPQEVVTIFRKISSAVEQDHWIGYPELEEFFQKGYYIQDFKQTLVDADRYMITFIFRQFKAGH